MFFGFKDLVDILLVALLLYETYRLLRTSGAVNLFWGILAYVGLWFLVSFILRLELTGAIFNFIGSAGAVALVVIFQEEIRGMFSRIGSRMSNAQFVHFHQDKKNAWLSDEQIHQVILACEHMSEAKVGALIVIAHEQELDEYEQTGETINADISARMIENIFFKNTPLHDGALIIRNGRLQSAACILPVSKNRRIPKHYGLRHRAALGLAEKTDAFCIVLSEETGRLSIAQDSRISTVKLSALTELLNNKQ
ncbi:MAG: diadenylate cyclase CdaA [Paludibacteraceae bacterium]|nr:diadenylate cyclase CdaA [Paludibacteraceae bacterium]